MMRWTTLRQRALPLVCRHSELVLSQGTPATGTLRSVGGVISLPRSRAASLTSQRRPCMSFVATFDALRWRTQLSRHFMDTTMRGVDVLILPCMPYALPTIADSDVDRSGEAVRALIGRITMYTRPFNLLGLPVVQIPAGFCPAGLPWGFQLVGHPFQEGLLLRLANHFMAQTPSLLRRPQL